jgi:hypothetical protein
MPDASNVTIGFMSPVSASRPHLDSFKPLVPEGVRLDIQEVGFAGTSRSDFKGRIELILNKTSAFAADQGWEGVIVPGAPVELYNPGLLERLQATLTIPAVTALSSCVDSLKAVGAKRVVFLTPFEEEMNDRLKAHVVEAGIDATMAQQSFERYDDANDISSEQVYEIASQAVSASGGTDAVYFQGAVLDPIPVLDRMERELGVTVLASNLAMLWAILSKMGLSYSVPEAGRLLRDWPAR